jgi:hypothetical protein
MADLFAEVGFQLSAAGIGLGAFSTTIDLLHTCKRGYDAWRGLRGLDQDLRVLRAKLILQQDLLELWQRDWYGPEIGNGPTGMRLRLLEAHKDSVESVVASVRSLLDQLAALRAFAETGKTPEGMQRAKWIANELQASRKALAEIESLLEGLYRLLPPRSPNLYAAQLAISLEDHDDNNDDSQAVENALESSSSHTIVSVTLGLRNARRSLHDELQIRVNEMKNAPRPSEVVIPPHKVTERKNDDVSAGFRSFAQYDGITAVIEWKKYDRKWQGAKRTQLMGRLDNLARLLMSDKKPNELNILRCDGYFNDLAESRFGFVFTLPQPSIGYPSSLKELISNKSEANLPTLEQRYFMAYSLGLSISILHAAGWLHKSIRSHNVLFLKEEDQSHSSRPAWSRPYLVGFDYSRPDGKDESSEKPATSKRFDIYRHPLSQGSPNERYQKLFDYYSFGALLLEIGLWRSLWDLWREGTPPESFRRELEATAQVKVAHCMGRDYAEAAMKCLNGELQRRGCSEQRAFFIEVVEVLGRYVAS